jgi:hypothetical protein
MIVGLSKDDRAEGADNGRGRLEMTRSVRKTNRLVRGARRNCGTEKVGGF